MMRYIFKKSKAYTWIMLLVILVGALSSMFAQYISKFIGFIIDYALNFTGETYSGPLSFLFDGRFGEYGSVQIAITLLVCVSLCALLSYGLTYLSYYIQMRGQHVIANKLRIEIFNRSKGVKMPISNGDQMILLHEDIYRVSTTFVSTYPTIITNIYTIIFTLFMLSSISPYLLITPIVMMPILIIFAIKYHKASFKENSLYREVDGELKESISKATASMELAQYHFFKKVNEKHTKERKQLSNVSNKYTMILNIIKISIYIISCTVAGVLAIKGKILIGEYLIFTAFINTIYAQIISLINNLITVKSCEPRIKKVEYLTEEYLNENK